MELKELTDKTMNLFGVTDPDQLRPALLTVCDDPDKLRSFCDLVELLPELMSGKTKID